MNKESADDVEYSVDATDVPPNEMAIAARTTEATKATIR